MGDRTLRYNDNIVGRWYTDQKCILCSVCAELAPENFKEARTNDHDIVYKQPINENEELQCSEAMKPVSHEAIGNDGALAVSCGLKKTGHLSGVQLFQGTLSNEQACQIVAETLKPRFETSVLPIGDGGRGTLFSG
ncbi:MAG: ferredoxin [Bdellovibrionota bacterium]